MRITAKRKGNEMITIQQAISIIKPEEHTMDSLRKAYRAISKKYHPDVNPNGLEMMKLINMSYDLLVEKFNSWSLAGFHPDEVSVDELLQEIFEKIKHCSGVKFEVIGSWLWVTGNTRPYKALFKTVGFKWSPNKVAWYWHPGEWKKFSKKRLDLDQIRDIYGSMILEGEKKHSIG